MTDYCDGRNCQNHPLFSVQKDSLQLLFYYDDVEICNPLGSKRTIHKLGMNIYAYYTSGKSVLQVVTVT